MTTQTKRRTGRRLAWYVLGPAAALICLPGTLYLCAVRRTLAEPERSFLSLDLRGRMVDEATVEIDRFIDDAELAGVKEITLIHGKGTGALRAGVQAYLRTHPQVKSFRIGAYGEGDAGVTVVTLR